LYLVEKNPGVRSDLGVAVAKKLAKRAVDRNKLKRMIREHVRNAQLAAPIGDVVMKLKKPIGRETRGKLRKKEQVIMRTQITALI
jgi:ribonuclease P protein component